MRVRVYKTLPTDRQVRIEISIEQAEQLADAYHEKVVSSVTAEPSGLYSALVDAGIKDKIRRKRDNAES